jgi:hypothetical protein
MVPAARFFLRGWYLKPAMYSHPDKPLKSTLASGKVRKLGLRYLVLEDDRGEKVHIPYSRISEQVLSSPPEEDTSHSHVVSLHIPRTVTPQVIKSELTSQLVNMPWVIVDNPPQVSVSVNNDEMFLAEVRFNVMKKEHALLVDESIKAFARQAYKNAR